MTLVLWLTSVVRDSNGQIILDRSRVFTDRGPARVLGILMPSMYVNVRFEAGNTPGAEACYFPWDVTVLRAP